MCGILVFETVEYYYCNHLDEWRLVCVHVCVCVKHGYCFMGDNGRLQYLRFCLFEMYVNVVFVMFVQWVSGQCSEFNSG